MPTIPLRWRLLAPLLLSLFACRPEVPLPHQVNPSAAAGNATVTAEPPAPLDNLPAVLRFHVAAAGVNIDPEGVVLIRGHATATSLREVQRRQISKALSERIVPALVFPEETSLAGVVVAPTVVLAKGERYTLAIADPGTLVDLKVTKSDPLPLLERVWPPEGRSATAGFGVWCGKAQLDEVDEPAQLSPHGQLGRMRRGATAEDPGKRCLRFEASPGEDGEGGIPPPLLPHAVSAGRLDPRSLGVDAAPQPLSPVDCAPGELAFGPGCAMVFDDRLAGRSPRAPALWTIQGDGIDRVFTTDAAAPFVIHPLMPNQAISLHVAAIDTRGEPLRAIFSATTQPPMAHIVLNEVLANPIGPEPAQEWVEIVNDGSALADLSGYVLVDIRGETKLPGAKLEPGRFALIVNDAFAEDDEYDPPPAPSALILRVPQLGKEGLANSGEPLKLLDPDGVVISRFPASPKPKAGMSLARRDPATPDGLPQGFAVAVPTPGQPNGP